MNTRGRKPIGKTEDTFYPRLIWCGPETKYNSDSLTGLLSLVRPPGGLARLLAGTPEFSFRMVLLRPFLHCICKQCLHLSQDPWRTNASLRQGWHTGLDRLSLGPRVNKVHEVTANRVSIGLTLGKFLLWGHRLVFTGWQRSA